MPSFHTLTLLNILYFGVLTFLQPALSSSSFLRFPESLSGTPYSIFLNLNLKAPCYIQGFSTKHTVRILDVTNMMNLFPSSENIFKINNSEWSFLLAVFFFLASAGTLLYFLAQKLHGVPFILGSTWLEQSIGGLFNRQKRNQQFRQWLHLHASNNPVTNGHVNTGKNPNMLISRILKTRILYLGYPFSNPNLVM